MKKNLPIRKNLRLQDYDYTLEGYYFITICTKNRKCILSKINNKNCRGEVPPSPENTKIGNEIIKTIKYLENKYKYIQFTDYIIMPNHIHFILENTGRGGTLPLHKIIQELKSYTNKKMNEINSKQMLKLWQRNYYEHIIRNESEYLKIKEYIQNNPYNWEKDKYFIN